MEEPNKNQKEFKIKNYININEFKYSYKCPLKNKFFSFRCFHRACKVLLTIEKGNIKKIEEKKGI